MSVMVYSHLSRSPRLLCMSSGISSTRLSYRLFGVKKVSLYDTQRLYSENIKLSLNPLINYNIKDDINILCNVNPAMRDFYTIWDDKADNVIAATLISFDKKENLIKIRQIIPLLENLSTSKLSNDVKFRTLLLNTRNIFEDLAQETDSGDFIADHLSNDELSSIISILQQSMMINKKCSESIYTILMRNERFRFLSIDNLVKIAEGLAPFRSHSPSRKNFVEIVMALLFKHHSELINRSCLVRGFMAVSKMTTLNPVNTRRISRIFLEDIDKFPFMEILRMPACLAHLKIRDEELFVRVSHQILTKCSSSMSARQWSEIFKSMATWQVGPPGLSTPAISQFLVILKDQINSNQSGSGWSKPNFSSSPLHNLSAATQVNLLEAISALVHQPKVLKTLKSEAKLKSSNKSKSKSDADINGEEGIDAFDSSCSHGALFEDEFHHDVNLIREDVLEFIHCLCSDSQQLKSSLRSKLDILSSRDLLLLTCSISRLLQSKSLKWEINFESEFASFLSSLMLQLLHQLRISDCTNIRASSSQGDTSQIPSGFSFEDTSLLLNFIASLSPYLWTSEALHSSVYSQKLLNDKSKAENTMNCDLTKKITHVHSVSDIFTNEKDHQETLHFYDKNIHSSKFDDMSRKDKILIDSFDRLSMLFASLSDFLIALQAAAESGNASNSSNSSNSNDVIFADVIKSICKIVDASSTLFNDVVMSTKMNSEDPDGNLIVSRAMAHVHFVLNSATPLLTNMISTNQFHSDSQLVFGLESICKLAVSLHSMKQGRRASGDIGELNVTSDANFLFVRRAWDLFVSEIEKRLTDTVCRDQLLLREESSNLMHDTDSKTLGNKKEVSLWIRCLIEAEIIMRFTFKKEILTLKHSFISPETTLMIAGLVQSDPQKYFPTETAKHLHRLILSLNDSLSQKQNEPLHLGELLELIDFIGAKKTSVDDPLQSNSHWIMAVRDLKYALSKHSSASI